MAQGPDAVIQNMQSVADEAEKLIDDAIAKQQVKIEKNETRLEFTVDIEKLIPKLTKEIWEAMLRKKYILAGWYTAEWITPINKFETNTIKLTK